MTNPSPEAVPWAVITDQLVEALSPLSFGPPVSHVYQPLRYARAPWDAYCGRYGQGSGRVLLLGMNPGPYGMAQVGVPFGEIEIVRRWLGVEATVDRPSVEHPKRPILGFACQRSEVSGARFWGWARDRYGTPDAFFARFFVANYCPLVFMAASGANVTPDKLPASERQPLFAACDVALWATIRAMRPRAVVGVGRFAEARIRAVLGPAPGWVIGAVPHPSPASPLANAGWASQMDAALQRLGLRDA